MDLDKFLRILLYFQEKHLNENYNRNISNFWLRDTLFPLPLGGGGQGVGLITSPSDQPGQNTVPALRDT
jgi:hypothetical protein